MRKRLLARNTISSLLFQITTLICGFVLPRLILSNFGSEVNGLITSITQFLSIISFLEMGVGAVVQSSLYKPLADNNVEEISKIVASAQHFFRRLASVFVLYIFGLLVLFPVIVDQSFGWIYTAGLIFAMALSSFAQYYFGIVNQLLLTADQKGYIQYNVQIITLILNTVACAILIGLGQSIHAVKITTSVIYLARPLFLHLYVQKYYSINRNIKYTGEPIKQKWNGVSQHIASVVLNSSASIILTVFSTLANVSIYSVYNLVIHGVKQLFLSMTNGIQALIGELWAKGDDHELRKVFDVVEWTIHTGTIFVFGCTGTLILPFIQVYTYGISDAVYFQPLFAILYTIAHAGHCLRLPYNMMILAAGQYKQTQNNYIIAAVLNIVISIGCVYLFGIIGVALGAMVSLFYQTFWMAYYNAKNLIKRPIKVFWKQFSVDIVSVLLGVILTYRLKMGSVSYVAWGFLAMKVAIVWVISIITVNLVFNKKKMVKFIVKLLKRDGANHLQ